MKILRSKIKNSKSKIIKIAQWCWATLPRRIVSCLVMAGLILSSAWYLFLKPAPAEAGWWDEDWLYRKSVTITNDTTAENNVYVIVDIGDTSDTDKFQTDCGDIRFTKRDGTILDYYIASGCGTGSTTIHILYDILEAGAQDLYFYYSNPSIDNGFETAGFSNLASNYSVGAIGSEEIGTGPVMWLRFDEGYGTTAYDATEQGNNGTISGASWTETAKFGKALNFDGSSSYVTVGDTNQNIKTVSLWIRPNSTSVTEEPIDLNGTAYVKITNGTVTGQGFTSPTIYINGISGASTVTTDWNHIVITTGTGINVSDLDIGRLDASYFVGLIDEVKIYNYALTAEQIKIDYNQGVALRFGD